MEYKVAKILGQKRFKQRNGRSITKYQVKWVGYDEPTWEPIRNLSNCRDKLDEFLASVGENEAKENDDEQSGDKENPSTQSPMLEYTVEKILDEKKARTRNGRSITKYLVKWDGYDKPTWEPIRNLSNCRDKIDEFLASRVRDEKQASDGMDSGSDSIDQTNESGPSTYTAMLHATATITKPSVSKETKASNVFDFDFDESDGEFDFDGTNLNKSNHSNTSSGSSESDNSDKDATQLDNSARMSSRQRNPRRKSTRLVGFLDSEESSAAEEDESDGDDVIQLVQSDNDDDEDDDANTVMENALGELKPDILREMSTNGYVDAYYGEDRCRAQEADNMYNDPPRLNTPAEAAAKTMQPIDLFFFFMPKQFWREVASETSRYEMQTRVERLRRTRTRLEVRYSSQVAAEKIAQAESALASFEEIQPHEILIMLGLLIARSICPIKMGIEHHWATSSKGAIPGGTWSRFMPRQRFRDINRYLHFSDNKHPLAKKDRAWKIRPVIDTLQRTFRAGLEVGRWVAFDEMVIPSRSSRNAVRIYLKNKPHKYGTKLFAACCGETNYCIRIEVYCGSRQDNQVVDTSSGPAAVIRNLQAIWPSNTVNRSEMRVVITDREYTSVSLLVRLLHMGYYNIGTVSTSRLGFPHALKYKFKTVPKRLANQRGLCRLVRCLEHPELFACSWLDNKPVYFLASGVSTRKSSVVRKEKSGASSIVSCPEFVASYNQYMNGVDAHDQLRLQRYSVQRALRVTKYYKTLFFGLLDIALVNCYILHREYCKNTQLQPMSHANFRVRLHQQLLDLTAKDFEDEVVLNANRSNELGSPHPRLPTLSTHTMTLSDDKAPSGKYRYRVCKVCSILHEESTIPIGNSRSYCVQCSTEKVRVYLCDRVRSTQNGNQLTCFQIWHHVWQNGAERSGGRRIRLRTYNSPEDTGLSASNIQE